MADRPRPRLASVPIDEGDGPTVLLVHGQPGSGADWGGLARELSVDHRVIAPDRPGWGAHPRPAAGLSENAAALARVLDCCAAETPVTAVGHSLGGGIALHLALERPDLVCALVLVGSVGSSAAVTGIDKLLGLPMVGDGLVAAGSAALRRGVRALRRVPEGSKVGRLAHDAVNLPSLKSLLEGSLGEPVKGRRRTSFVVEQRALLQDTPLLEARLGDLHVPVAVVNGASDHIVPPAAARRLAELIPGAELVMIGGAGHLVAFEQPAELAKIVRRYVRLAEARSLKDGRQPPASPATSAESP